MREEMGDIGLSLSGQTDANDASEIGKSGDVAGFPFRNDHGALFDSNPELPLPLEPGRERQVGRRRIVNTDVPQHHPGGTALVVAAQVGLSRGATHRDGDPVELLMTRMEDMPAHDYEPQC